MASSFAGLRAIASQAAVEGVLPGLVVAVGLEGRTVFREAFGLRQTEPMAAPATADMVYDVASLTKPLCTSLLAMRAVERGALALDGRLPDRLGVAAQGVTLRRLLAHAAGFPAHRPFHERVAGMPATEARSQIARMAAREPLAYEPGSRSLYSDVGFILLGSLIEHALGASLDVLARAALFDPLWLGGMGFREIGVAAPARRPIAPTERCPVRGRLMAGEVHDLNAHAMGGVAGHAGLFAAADDVAVIAHALVAAWRGDGPATGWAPIVDRDVLRAFWQPCGVPGSTWRLGWDGPADSGSLAGSLIARTAVGHLAFTGCSLWIDPEHEAFVVVLSNRVHPTVRDDPRFRALRPALNDAALAAIGYRS